MTGSKQFEPSTARTVDGSKSSTASLRWERHGRQEVLQGETSHIAGQDVKGVRKEVYTEWQNHVLDLAGAWLCANTS
jgi:hypothetical protein